MNEAGADARRLLEHLAARDPDLLRGPLRGRIVRRGSAGGPGWRWPDPAAGQRAAAQLREAVRTLAAAAVDYAEPPDTTDAKETR